MEIEILKETKKEIEMSVEGVGHAFLNMLMAQLAANKDVEIATYSPFSKRTVVKVRMRTGEARKAINKALDAIKRDLKA